MSYKNDFVWKEMQGFLPLKNRLSEENMPEEYFLTLLGMQVHIDHHKVANPKATLILFHGVGGNGRLLSFILGSCYLWVDRKTTENAEVFI